MGWVICFQVLRDEPLADEERTRLAAFSKEREAWDWDSEPFSIKLARAARPDSVVGHGAVKISMDDESLDGEQVMTCLDDLVLALPGSRVLVMDDFGAFGTDKLLELGDRGAFVTAKELLGKPPRSSAPTGAAAMLARLAEIDDHDDPESAELVGELARSDADDVISAALRSYESLSRTWWDVSAPFEAAVKRASDHARWAPAFNKLWKTGGGTYWHHDLLGNLGTLIRAVASDDRVDDQMCEDLAEPGHDSEDERACRRAGNSARVLRYGTSDRSLLAMLALLQQKRDLDLSHTYNHHVVLDVLEAVADRADPRAFATLVLTLDRMTSHTRALQRAAIAIGTIDPARSEPMLLQMAKLNIFPSGVADGLAAGASAEGEAALEVLLTDPLQHVRRRAASALSRRRGVELAPPAIDWDPYAHFTHPRVDVRHQALREVAEQKQARDVLGLALAGALDARLRRVVSYPGLPFSWSDWELPEDVKRLSANKMAAWAQENAANQFGDQRIPDCVRPIIESGLDAVAARYPDPLFRLSAGAREAFEDEERTITESS